MDCRMPGFPVHHQLPELAQIHDHRVGDTIQSSHPFSCLQSFPASGSFLVNQFFTSGGLSIGVSVSASVIPVNIQDWFPLRLVGVLQHHSSKASILHCSAFFMVQLSHLYMTTEKTIALTRRTFVGKVMSLLFNMLSGLLMTLLPKE